MTVVQKKLKELTDLASRILKIDKEKESLLSKISSVSSKLMKDCIHAHVIESITLYGDAMHFGEYVKRICVVCGQESADVRREVGFGKFQNSEVVGGRQSWDREEPDEVLECRLEALEKLSK